MPPWGYVYHGNSKIDSKIDCPKNSFFHLYREVIISMILNKILNLIISLIYFSSLGFLYYLSSTLNPLLYTILSVKYRESFKKVILCRNERYK